MRKFQSVCRMILMIAAPGFYTHLVGQEQAAPPSPAFKATTRLVVVEVIASNGKGEPVTDLEAEDFTILENGKPQQISAFNLQLPGSRQTPDTQTPAEKLPPNVFSNVPHYKQTGTWNVLLMDYMNSQVISQADLRQQLVKVLEKLPNEPLAIYLLTDKLRLLHAFSMDQAALGRLIGTLKNYVSVNLDNAKGGHEMERYPAGFLDSLPAQSREAVIGMEADVTASRTQTRLRQTVEALNQIVRNIAGLPGRKNLIWVSQAFPLSIDPGSVVNGFDAATGRQFEISVPGTANALLDSQVAIYPIDPSGIHLPDNFDPAGHGTDALGRKETTKTVDDLYDAERITHSSVNELAERSGGRAFYNVNDIGSAIVQSMHDGGTYYMLAYYPADKNWNGKFRHIVVKVSRSGVKLRHRTGYFAVEPGVRPSDSKLAAEQEVQFHQAMELDSPVATSVFFNAKVLPVSSPHNNGIVVQFQLRPGAVTTESANGGLQRASVECAVQAFNEKGAPVNAAGNTLAGNLRPEGYQKVLREGFPCNQTLQLGPGTYRLRLGVRDNLSGRIGTADARVTLPEPAQQQ